MLFAGPGMNFAIRLVLIGAIALVCGRFCIASNRRNRRWVRKRPGQASAAPGPSGGRWPNSFRVTSSYGDTSVSSFDEMAAVCASHRQRPDRCRA